LQPGGLIQTLSGIRTWATVAVNTLIAVFGTAVAESPVAHVFRPQTGLGVIRREWITSVVVAGALGFLVQRSLKVGGGKWSWILPSVFFLLGVLLDFRSSAALGLFSGHDCAMDLGSIGCRDFLLFTVPFIRGLAYSAGAVLAGRPLLRRGH
jgi:hypothetical protein